MTNAKPVPRLSGQWVNLVQLKEPPIQLPNRPQQQIDSYSTIWQKGNKLWSGDSSGTVDSPTRVTLYGDQVPYQNGEIIWGSNGLNADVRTVDIAGMWIDENDHLYTLAQKITPVTLTQKEQILGLGFTGSITGHTISTQRDDSSTLTGVLSQDCFAIEWSNGSTWKRHMNINGYWVSVMDTSTHETIIVKKDKVIIGGITGNIDHSIWYLRADQQPFPTNKKEGGIDFDCTAIHWYDYIGWLRKFIMDGSWIDNEGEVHAIFNYRIKNPDIKSRFTWQFSVSSSKPEGTSGEMIRNWIELKTKTGEKRYGVVHYESDRIDWASGDTWLKQKP